MSDDNRIDKSRRGFLALVPLGIFGGIVSTLGVAALRFLRPRIIAAGSDRWIDVASVAEINGASPLVKKIQTDNVNGWATTKEVRQVFVLPTSNTVLSAICPHEGCEVFWEDEKKRFSCPCHESYFAPDGSRLTGPARRGLDQLPSRVQDGTVQVQYQPAEAKHNTTA